MRSEIEEEVANYFRELGFQVVNVEPGSYHQFYENLKTGTARRLTEIIPEKMLSGGVPDLLIFKETTENLSRQISNHFWVEVKSETDSWRKSQFEWSKDFLDENIVLAWQIDQEFSMCRIDRSRTELIKSEEEPLQLTERELRKRDSDA